MAHPELLKAAYAFLDKFRGVYSDSESELYLKSEKDTPVGYSLLFESLYILSTSSAFSRYSVFFSYSGPDVFVSEVISGRYEYNFPESIRKAIK